LRGQQGSVYEGGIRVPMIVRWPAQIKPGETSDLTWAAWDFLPTLAEIALTKPLEKLDGISILPTLLGKKQKNRHESFYWQASETVSSRRSAWKIGKGFAPTRLRQLNFTIFEPTRAKRRMLPVKILPS
jgi:arylsulfatase A-like enzyme